MINTHLHPYEWIAIIAVVVVVLHFLLPEYEKKKIKRGKK
jgi:hypothetical protein